MIPFKMTPLLLLLLLQLAAGYKTKRGSPEEWSRVAAEQLRQNRDAVRLEKRAKNMILFIGDGMSIPTVTAARLWKAQQEKDSEPGRQLLEFEDVPFVGLAKTYTDDFIVPDSGATAFAMLSGVKTNSLTVGVDSTVQFKNCSSYSPEKDIRNIFAYAAEAGLSTGLVTTTQLTHATPASTYGHSASRYWMSDRDLAKDVKDPELRKHCVDLASQFLRNAINFTVVLAGGKGKLTPPEEGGEREDGRNILKEWKMEQRKLGRTARLVETKDGLQAAAEEKGLDRLLGIFASGNFPYFDERSDPKHASIPSLVQMVTAAIKILSRNPNGFFLLVEGGRIDHAHHYGMARRALQETLNFNEAYKTARRLTRPDDTLMIATADHSHVFTLGGYPSRGKDILTFPDQDTEGKGKGKAADGLPFTILLYANGPGAKVGKARSDPSLEDTTAVDYKQQAAVPLRKETHGGDDVAIYARGPMAHLINGVREQNYIAHVFMHAACLGPYRANNDCPTARAASHTASIWWVLTGALLCALVTRRL